MIESSHQHKFTAELRRAGLGGRRDHPASSPPDDGAAERRHREVLQALSEIRCLIGDRRHPDEGACAVEQPAAPATGNITANITSAIISAAADDELRSELQALHAAITQTKREIAALREMGKPPSHLATATDELDAVVRATETATECILSSSERIDGLLTGLRNQAASADETAGIDEIGEQVTRIFEACNFQDITGQRITKVVNALKFVEERVQRMIAVLGGERAIDEVVKEIVPEKKAEDDESHLLSGPQLDQHKISQDDIDAFFN